MFGAPLGCAWEFLGDGPGGTEVRVGCAGGSISQLVTAIEPRWLAVCMCTPASIIIQVHVHVLFSANFVSVVHTMYARVKRTHTPFIYMCLLVFICVVGYL